MKKIFAVATVTVLTMFMAGQTALGEVGQRSTMAKLCAACHQPEPGLMMGFLDNISLKSKIIQMDLMSHKEIVKFNDDTSVKYVEDFADIRNYRTKGFQINFTESNGEKIAREVIRFDILKAIADDEKLTREQFMEQRRNPQVRVYDVRPPVKYQMAHIPGAAMMPAPAFDKFIDKLPLDKSTPIIFYGVGGCLSPTAAMKTKSLGYENVRIYTGGYPDWVKSGEYGIVESAWLQQAITDKTPYVLVDLRDPADVTRGHIPGAVAISAAQLTAAREMFPPQKNAPIILYGPGSEEAAREIRSWGYKFVQLLNESFDAWQAAGKPTKSGSALSKIDYEPKPAPGTISPADFSIMAGKKPDNIILVDVRNPDELESGSIPGAINIPADLIVQKVSRLPEDKEPILYCSTGARAGMAHTSLSNIGRKSRYLDAIIEFKGNSFEIVQ
ncbi:MAG: rhodanese-like domain-containing protein [Desulfobulbaceae bacterium]|nr:rhodanese-like domain-containing protein [Desulfobulbaceae bacterium]